MSMAAIRMLELAELNPTKIIDNNTLIATDSLIFLQRTSYL